MNRSQEQTGRVVGKIAGRIERADLADIFARAERLRSERGGGRLGRAMLDELMARAKELAKGPNTRTLKRISRAPGSGPLGETVSGDEPAEQKNAGFASGVVEGFSENAPPAAPPRLNLSSSSDELGVLPDSPITSDDPRAQPRPAPSLRQLSDLIEERSARDTAVFGALDVPDAAAGGLDAILAQATELTFEGYEEELASLLEETYERYQSGTFALFPGEPAPGAPPQATPTARRDSPLANWRPPPMPDLPSPSRPPAPVSWGPELPPRVPPPTRPFARDPSLAEPPRAAQAVHDPFVEDPFELLPSAADPAAATIQGFGEQLLRHGAGGMLERKNPPRGQAVSVPIRTVFDPSRSLFGAPLEPRLEPGDRFQLRDGQIYRVIESEFVFVGETPCYQEVRAQPLGSLRVPLHKSWEGNFPT